MPVSAEDEFRTVFREADICSGSAEPCHHSLGFALGTPDRMVPVFYAKLPVLRRYAWVDEEVFRELTA